MSIHLIRSWQYPAGISTAVAGSSVTNSLKADVSARSLESCSDSWGGRVVIFRMRNAARDIEGQLARTNQACGNPRSSRSETDKLDRDQNRVHSVRP